MIIFVVPDFRHVTGQSEISRISAELIKPDKILFQNNSLINALSIVTMNYRSKPELVYITLSRSTIGAIRDNIFLKILSPKRIISHIHGFRFLEPNRFLQKNVLKSDDVIVLTEMSAKNMYEVYPCIKKKSIHVVRNPLNISQKLITFEKKRKYRKLSICYFSNLMKSKGALEFMLLADKYYHKYNFNVAGRNLEKIKLSKNVCYNGPVYYTKKVDFLNENHILIFYSTYVEEFYPISLIEAISFGMLCFVKRHNNLDQIFDEKNIIWVDSYREIFQYLESEAKLSDLQKEALQWTKKNHRKILEKYSIARYQQDLQNILNE